MQTFPLSDYESDFTQSGFDKLSISLNKIRQGNDVVLVTPQAKRVGPDEILEEWDIEFSANLKDINDDLLELELSNKKKFGPRSIAKPWNDIRQGVLESYEIPRVDVSHLNSVPRNSAEIGILRPLSLANSAKLTKSNTQAGAPTLDKKGVVREYTYDNFNELFNKSLPMIPAIRTQENGRTRIVKIVDYATIMQENRYFVPLFNQLSKEFCFSGFQGPDAVNSAITNLLHEAVSMGYSCISGDIEGFDDSVGYDLQKSAFDEISLYFQKQYRDEIAVLGHRFNTSGFVTPDNVVLVGSHGIPSGSNFTGAVGSIVNRQVSQHPLELSQFMGDDFTLIAKDARAVFRNYSSCGLTLNKSKTLIKPSSFVYLQRLHHVDYVTDGEYKGIYPTYRALLRLCYPEKFSDFNDYDLDGRNYFAIRSLSILENCKYHPLFEKFVKFWLKFEKYKVPSNRSIGAYVKMRESSIGSLGTTNQYGDDINGLRSFKSYQIAVSLS